MNNAYLCKTYLEVWLKVAYHTSTNNKPTYHITTIHTNQKSNCCITFLKTKTLMSKLIHLQRILKQESSINNFSLYVCVSKPISWQITQCCNLKTMTMKLTSIYTKEIEINIETHKSTLGSLKIQPKHNELQ